MAAGDLALRILISALDTASPTFARVGASAGHMSEMLKSFGTVAAVAATVAIVKFGVESVKAAADFQQGLTRLVTGAGDVTDNMQKLGQGILDVSVATGVAANGTQGLNAAMYLIISSGQRGAQALDTLSVAAKGAQIEQASVVDVANVLSGAMTNYGTKVYNATDYMNGLIKAVQNGKITLQQLAVAMGPIDPIAHDLGISFNDVAAAMTTQTNAMIPAARAATGLRFMMLALENPTKKAKDAMSALGLNSVDVANEMKKSLPGALQMIYEAAKRAGPEGSVPFNRAVADMVGGMRSLSTFAALTGGHMKDFVKNSQEIALAMKQNKDAVQGWDQAQGNFNIQMDIAKQAMQALMITIGSALLPVLTRLVANITPIILGFTSWITSGHVISDVMGFLGKNIQIVAPIIALLAGIMVAALVPAIGAAVVATWSWTAALLANPITWVVLAIVALVAIIAHFYQTSAPFRDVMNQIGAAFQRAGAFIAANFMPAMAAVGGFLQSTVLPILKQIGAFLVSTFAPVWQQLVGVWNGQILPSLKQLWAALQPLAPVFVFLAKVVGVILVVALGLLVGIITGVIKAIAGIASGLATVIGGIVQFVTGIIQIVSGVVTFIYDLVTGHFSKLGADLGTIWQGIVNIFQGAWSIIVGLFQAAWGAISGLVSGLVQGVIGFFTNLWNTLVGHSIIPDMINGIINWFAQLPGRVIAFISNLVTMAVMWFFRMRDQLVAAVQVLVAALLQRFQNLVNQAVSTVSSLAGKLGQFFSNLAGQAVQWGANVIQGLINGITSMIGNVTNAIGNIVGVIASHLPHSPVKMGPLVGLENWGGTIVHMLATDMIAKTPLMANAARGLAGSVASAIQPGNGFNVGLSGGGNAFALTGGSSASNGQGTMNLTIVMDGREITNVVGIRMSKELRLQANVKK